MPVLQFRKWFGGRLMPIRLLPPQLVSQIAAGEVVERPASVVKELVENSLDAGARSITIELERGGMRRIRVRDDGIGIPRDELAVALMRHATSKLTDLAGLEQVATLGFRGEALPSIASVAQLSLTSRARGADDAWCVTGRGDDAAEPIRPAAHPPGTTVEVRELFAEVPARRRFLRSEATEFRHAHQLFRSMSAGCFEVGFRLRHNGKDIIHLPVADTERARRERIGRLCGAAFVDHALRLDEQAAGMALAGWIAT
ncbi:MAG: DNA mismatch repair endonuclease MutL, partial [Salinisphaera sp.]|nr:DNA mismatch repair endonuclease MutL [Salinisphaera sp.]